MNPVWKMIEDLSSKRGISEIAINGPKNVFVERGGEFIGLNVSFSKGELLEFVSDVAKYNKKKCDETKPMLDGNLPDGSRVNIVLEPLATSSCAITIRKYTKTNMSLEQNSESFGIDPYWVPFFRSLVKSRQNIIISGGTGVGKTTFMNMLLKEIPLDERIVTIEDSLELSLSHPNVVRLESGAQIERTNTMISTRELVKNTLRMRPDRILVGEVRGAEVFDLLQAMNTGHEGSMTSVHANSSIECLSRIETLFMMAGFDIPYHVVRRHMSQAIDFIIQIGRSSSGKRTVKQVLEVQNMEGSNILTSSILDIDNGQLSFTGVTPSRLQELVSTGLVDQTYFS